MRQEDLIGSLRPIAARQVEALGTIDMGFKIEYTGKYMVNILLKAISQRSG